MRVCKASVEGGTMPVWKAWFCKTPLMSSEDVFRKYPRRRYMKPSWMRTKIRCRVRESSESWCYVEEEEYL